MFDDNLVTNFPSNQELIYRVAIFLCFLEDYLAIEDNAYDEFGKLIPDCKALIRLSDRRDLSDFWKEFRSLKSIL